MDADDRAHPQRLEKQLTFMQAYPEIAVLGCQVRGFPEELERFGGYQEHGWAEDYDLWLRVFRAGGRFAKLPEVPLD
jgi:hypothetical protein